METVLMATMYLFTLYWIGRVRLRWEWIGGLIGLSVWIRPDGITLLGPALFVLVLVGGTWRERGLKALRLAGGLVLLFAPYLLFNLQFQGSLWPNTFYAKQAEYAALQEISILLRYLSELSLPLIGAGALLAPGFIYRCWRAAVDRDWQVVATLLWFLGYAGLYAWRLPVTYQYGRYLMPAMPVFFVLGLSGLALLWRRITPTRMSRLASFGYRLALAGGVVGFYLLGAHNYARDVAIIETEMVAAAKWIAANTNRQDLIAVHDIGAMGYYGGRDIIDLAGLVSPEILPMIRDEPRLAEYLDKWGAAYLVTFPGWYSELPRGLQEVYSTGGSYAPDAGGENLAIYAWR
jgi:hypothetical protein